MQVDLDDCFGQKDRMNILLFNLRQVQFCVPVQVTKERRPEPIK